MRIISGNKKSIVINAPKNLPVRPTTDKVKESLFNIIQNKFEFNECRILDIFSGKYPQKISNLTKNQTHSSLILQWNEKKNGKEKIHSLTEFDDSSVKKKAIWMHFPALENFVKLNPKD